jgi:hypothetical protein
MKMAQFLSHIIPFIASIDSIEFKGAELIDIIIYHGLLYVHKKWVTQQTK